MEVNQADGFFSQTLSNIRQRNKHANCFYVEVPTQRWGAQGLFCITPDLSTFGKGMANGFPLSAVVGRRDVMMEMEEIFFSETFGGELLFLAAEKTVLNLHLNHNISGRLGEIGGNLKLETEKSINYHGLNDVINFSGHDSWVFINWTETKDYSVSQLKTYFMQEMFSHGVLILNTHNVTTAISEKEISKISDAYHFTLDMLNKNLREASLEQNLRVKPTQQLFRVR